MRISPALLAALTVLVLAGSSCSDGGSDASADIARDPASTTATSSPGPAAGPPSAAVPAGPVRTRDIATVMDTGQGPELCLGPVAESYPPQCSGPALLGWDWADHDGTYEQVGEVRWATYAVSGTWDGTAMTVTEAVPGALYDPAMPTPVPTPSPATAYDDERLEEIATELAGAEGVLGAYGGQGSEGHVLVDVVYDDGTLQGWADEAYGAGVVLVTSALVDAG